MGGAPPHPIICVAPTQGRAPPSHHFGGTHQGAPPPIPSFSGAPPHGVRHWAPTFRQLRAMVRRDSLECGRVIHTLTVQWADTSEATPPAGRQDAVDDHPRGWGMPDNLTAPADSTPDGRSTCQCPTAWHDPGTRRSQAGDGDRSACGFRLRTRVSGGGG